MASHTAVTPSTWPSATRLGSARRPCRDGVAPRRSKYFIFALYLPLFQLILDVFILNTQELVFGWKVYDYVSYQRYRFSVRDQRSSPCGNITPLRHRRGTASARWRRASTPSPRRWPRDCVCSMADRRGRSIRSEFTQNRKKDHPAPSLLETSRVDGVKAAQNSLVDVHAGG